jgi:hypothetical protein
MKTPEDSAARRVRQSFGQARAVIQPKFARTVLMMITIASRNGHDQRLLLVGPD